MGDKGANFVFRVMGVITSDRKHFSNTDPLCIAPTQVCVCVCGGGGGSKNWASSFRVILGFFVVSLQFEPADARVLVEHPVPRCPSCTPMLFGVHVPQGYSCLRPVAGILAKFGSFACNWKFDACGIATFVTAYRDASGQNTMNMNVNKG